MILLTSTSDLVQLTSGGSQQLNIHASYVDQSAPTTFTPGRANTLISNTVPTTIVGSPGSSVQRNLKFLSVQNTDATTAVPVTITHTDGTNVVQLWKALLPAGYTVTYNDLLGWLLLDASGGRVETSIGGRLLKTTVLTSLVAATAFTFGSGTRSFRIRACGSGGQGGGNAATTGCVGSGAGSGAYAEWNGTVAPSAAATYQCGTGGSTGTAGQAGQAGTSTTFAVGGVTLTVPGGSGGNLGAAVAVIQLGGSGGAVPTLSSGSLTIAAAGTAGESSGNGAAAADNVSGAGGSCPMGGGANGLAEASNTNGNSAALLGFGGGGSGSATSAGTARTGGAGAQGGIVVDEFSG